jgi:hypothetical protein
MSVEPTKHAFSLDLRPQVVSGTPCIGEVTVQHSGREWPNPSAVVSAWVLVASVSTQRTSVASRHPVIVRFVLMLLYTSDGFNVCIMCHSDFPIGH